jgi:hypothetical protein
MVIGYNNSMSEFLHIDRQLSKVYDGKTTDKRVEDYLNEYSLRYAEMNCAEHPNDYLTPQEVDDILLDLNDLCVNREPNWQLHLLVLEAIANVGDLEVLGDFSGIFRANEALAGAKSNWKFVISAKGMEKGLKNKVSRQYSLRNRLNLQ